MPHCGEGEKEREGRACQLEDDLTAFQKAKGLDAACFPSDGRFSPLWGRVIELGMKPPSEQGTAM